MLPCYLINLDRAPDRLDFISRRLRDLAITYVRIAATDGNVLPETERKAFIAARPRDGRSWSNGQIGCFMSHTEAWRDIVESGLAHAVVIEDDVHVSDTARVFLQDASWIPADADIVRLESTGQWLKLAKGGTNFQGRSVRRVKSTAWATGAYIITKSAVSKLLATDEKLHSPVDDFLFNLEGSKVAQGLTVYQLVPALVEQDKFIMNQSASKGFGSDIEVGNIFQRMRGITGMLRSIVSAARGKSEVGFR
ncbi:MAG: glycosyltransferase family 25 protein [Cytophagaceae bacterium]|nr:MAG: glycosyltransferase family 25 protein [Cytophagaceae bacterium]